MRFIKSTLYGQKWIYKGKLSSVSLYENEWMIPELVEPKPHEDGIHGHYLWRTELPNPPEEYPDINEVDSIALGRFSETNKWVADFLCVNKHGPHGIDILDKEAAEKLGLYLMSHPLVERYDNYICTISQKNGSEYEMLRADPRAKEKLMSRIRPERNLESIG